MFEFISDRPNILSQRFKAATQAMWAEWCDNNDQGLVVNYRLEVQVNTPLPPHIRDRLLEAAKDQQRIESETDMAASAQDGRQASPGVDAFEADDDESTVDGFADVAAAGTPPTQCPPTRAQVPTVRADVDLGSVGSLTPDDRSQSHPPSAERLRLSSMSLQNLTISRNVLSACCCGNLFSISSPCIFV
jgi:hypothetical protein